MAENSSPPEQSKKLPDTSKIKNHVLSPESKHPDIPYARTGCTLLDLVVGGGIGMGFPFGKIINLVGDKSSGKTFLANEIIAKNYHTFKKRLAWNYDDGENGYTFDTKALYGFDVMTKDTIRSRTVEEFDVNSKRFLNRVKELGIYVLDSLDGLSNEDIDDRAKKRFAAAETGKEFKAGTYGMKTPKFLSQEFFKTKTKEFHDTNSLLIIISQVRENIDPYSFQKFNRSGGKALDFYAHTCLWLATWTKLKRKVAGEERVVGVLVRARTDKSKTPRPFRECSFSLYFDYGIDNIGSNLDYLFDLRTKEDGKLKDTAAAIPWSGQPRNLENVKTFLANQDVLERARKEKLKETGEKKLTLAWLNDWIGKNEKLSAAAEKEFGLCMSRDELIAAIEKDPVMEKELERRVIEKWENVENAMTSNRKQKYQ